MERASRKPRSGSARAASRRTTRQGWLFIAPGIGLYGLFVIYPFIQNIYLSLTSWNGLSPTKKFVGLENYLRLFGDEVFWGALGRNLIWAVLATAVPMAIGLLLAMLLHSLPRGYAAFRTILFFPQLLVPVAVAVVFAWIYQPTKGILNQSLRAFGLDSLTRTWLGDPNTALFAVIAVAIWVQTGLAFIIFVAALQELDPDLVAAAQLDGAGWWRRLWAVVIPQISNAMNLIAAVLIIDALNAFDEVWAMTQGGPAGSTELTSTYLYQAAFVDTETGYGAAISTTSTAITLLIIGCLVLLREWREDKA